MIYRCNLIINQYKYIFKKLISLKIFEEQSNKKNNCEITYSLYKKNNASEYQE